MGILSLIGLVLKLGGIAIVGVFIYSLIRSDLMSPAGTIVWLAVAVGLVLLSWNTSDGDLIAVIVHGLVPAVVALFAGGMTYQSSGAGTGQYIGVGAGAVVTYLLTLLLSTFMSNIVTALLAVGLAVAFWKLMGSSLVESYQKKEDREAELKDLSHTRSLDAQELRELNRLTGNKLDAERDRALEEYNKYHPNDTLSEKDKA
ncbi:MAG: hypothetical protein IKU70_03985 [Clostridia bacterium]|nr:hypothetical protein [Clostridia bacterium]